MYLLFHILRKLYEHIHIIKHCKAKHIFLKPYNIKFRRMSLFVILPDQVDPGIAGIEAIITTDLIKELMGTLKVEQIRRTNVKLFSLVHTYIYVLMLREKPEMDDIERHKYLSVLLNPEYIIP